ncbi:MAG: family 43 glycosylhydrolase, partial [Acidimicrobiales bacterium]
MFPSPLTTRRNRSLRCPAILALLGALVAVMGTASIGVATAPGASAANWAPVHPGDFPDPSIVYDQATDTYYAFATQNFATPSQTINIQVSTSTDGVDWTQLNGVDALPTVGSWAKAGETWAPNVAYDSTDSEFVM